MDIKFTMNVERYGDSGVQESTLFNLPLRGTPVAEFNILSPQKDCRGRAQVTRYLVFNAEADKDPHGYMLLSMGEDHGVPVFAYRYAMDNLQLADHLRADGLLASDIKKLSERLGVPLPVPDMRAEQDVSDAIYTMMDVREKRAAPKIAALLRPLPKNTP